MQSTFMIDGETGTCIMMKNKEVIIAFDADDIDKTFLIFKEASFIMIKESTVDLSSFWTKGYKYFNILGPDGERLEFNQIL